MDIWTMYMGLAYCIVLVVDQIITFIKFNPPYFYIEKVLY